MRGFAGRCALVGVVVLLAAGCRPEIEFDVDGRQSQIDRVQVAVTVDAAGHVHVEQRFTFADEKGGTVGVPDLTGFAFISGATNLTLDGEPATPSEGTFQSELRIKARRGNVAYDVSGAVTRYADIAVLMADVLPSPEDASRRDPDVRLSGTLTLPAGVPGTVEPHLHGVREPKLVVEGQVVRFSGTAPIWMPSHELNVAFPSALVPFVETTPLPFLDQFRLTEQIRDQADETLGDTLSSLDSQSELARWILTGVAFGLPAIFWLFVVKAVLVRLRDRKRAVGEVPEELSDPPTGADPAVVAVLEGEGRPDREAVAGTVLAMAARKELDLQAFGDRLVVKVPLATTGANRSEQIVLEQLRRSATPEGVIEGRPIWRGSTRWWTDFRRDAVKRAHEQGLATRWMPLLPLTGALTTTGVGAGMFFFTNATIYVAIVMSVQVLAWVVSFVSGWTLTDAGWRQRALWHGFARYIRHQGKLDKDVGPEGVVVWGPYLVYGAVLGEAKGASRPLTPR